MRSAVYFLSSGFLTPAAIAMASTAALPASCSTITNASTSNSISSYCSSLPRNSYVISLKRSFVRSLQHRHSHFASPGYIVPNRSYQSTSALFDRGSGSSDDKKKFITKEQEPDQYWQTPDEKDGKNPMSTPLPYIAILGILSPFLILALAFVNGWIKVPVR